MLELELMTKTESVSVNADTCMPVCVPTDSCHPNNPCGPHM